MSNRSNADQRGDVLIFELFNSDENTLIVIFAASSISPPSADQSMFPFIFSTAPIGRDVASGGGGSALIGRDAAARKKNDKLVQG